MPPSHTNTNTKQAMSTKKGKRYQFRGNQGSTAKLPPLVGYGSVAHLEELLATPNLQTEESAKVTAELESIEPDAAAGSFV
jgi:argininosuccinate lyase